MFFCVNEGSRCNSRRICCMLGNTKVWFAWNTSVDAPSQGRALASAGTKFRAGNHGGLLCTIGQSWLNQFASVCQANGAPSKWCAKQMVHLIQTATKRPSTVSYSGLYIPDPEGGLIFADSKSFNKEWMNVMTKQMNAWMNVAGHRDTGGGHGHAWP